MDEPLTKLIRIRLSSRQYRRLSEASALSGQTLSQYIRQQLTDSHHLTEELTLLRLAISRLDLLTQTHRAAAEAVLLTRALARPEQIAIAHAALRRITVEPLSF